MKTEVKEIGKNLVEVTIEIDAKSASTEYEKACKKVAEHVNIAGFRKGKAPKNVVERYAGVDNIKREALEAILPKAFSDIIKEKNYELITEPVLVSYELEEGKPCKVVANFELRPEVKIKAYKGLTVEADEYKNAEDAVDKELERLAGQYAEFVKVENRKTTDKDTVVIDFEGFANGEPIKGGSAKNYSLDIAHSSFIPGFAEQLVDKEAGKEFTINVKFPENYHEESLKGADAEFKITINEIKEKKIPAIDDELAKKVGNFKTLNELKEDIQKYLENVAKSENERRAYQAIFNTILESAEMDIQESMINREVDAIIADMKARAQQRGQNLDAAIEKEGVDKVRKEMEPEAVSRIKNSLIISEIARAENVKVTASDMEAKLVEISRVYGVDKETMLKELYKNNNLLHSLSQQIIGDKVSRLIVDNNTVNFKK